MHSNRKEGIVFQQPRNKQQRIEIAGACQLGLDLTIPLLIDNMDNAVEQAYAAWPDRLYIVAADGRIAYKGGMGPQGFKPREMEKALKNLLKEEHSGFHSI